MKIYTTFELEENELSDFFKIKYLPYQIKIGTDLLSFNRKLSF